jgi:hypothetical protein
MTIVAITGSALPEIDRWRDVVRDPDRQRQHSRHEMGTEEPEAEWRSVVARCVSGVEEGHDPVGRHERRLVVHLLGADGSDEDELRVVLERQPQIAEPPLPLEPVRLVAVAPQRRLGPGARVEHQQPVAREGLARLGRVARRDGDPNRSPAPAGPGRGR